MAVESEPEKISSRDELLAEAKTYMLQGRRFMAINDIQSAADAFEHACQLHDAVYTIGKRQCADAYLEYGIALVALANVEAGSGKLMPTSAHLAPDSDDDDDDESTDDVTNGDKKDDAETSDANGEPQPSTSTSDGASKPATDDDDDDDDEPTTIEIAWEVLCLAKRVFELDESREGRLKLAETLQRIGEISIEWDNNENAVSILEQCLEIRKAILTPDDRLIALTYYHLGLAHSFKNEIDEANENFQNAVKVIETRLATQNERLEKAKEAGDTGAISVYMKEINELKDLLPDMLMRIDDSKEDAEKSNEVIKRTREEQEKEDEELKKVCSDKTKPVDDITHLVKRRA